MERSQKIGFIELLQDDSERIQAELARQARALGAEGESLLQEATQHANSAIAHRARTMLGENRRQIAWEALLEETRIGDPNLWRFHAQFSRLDDPHCDTEAMQRTIDDLAHKLKDLLDDAMDAEAVGRALARVLHEDAGFHGATGEYYDPRNSYLCHVLERRSGIPISLAAVMLLVGRRAGLSLAGVGMPYHFLVRLTRGDETILLDPFRGGRITTREDCRIMLAGFQRAFRSEYLRSVTDRELLLRSLANLVRIYQQTENELRASQCRTLIERLQAPLRPE